MTCKTCGERMEGDGYTRVIHCPNALDTEYVEPDANPIHCEPQPAAHFDTDGELWNADPNCQHDEQPAPGGGVKCTKCPGWFCY